jgi:hypothetical protein
VNNLTVKQGDLLPHVGANLTVSNPDGTTSIPPLTNAAVRFRMRLASGGAIKVDAAAVVDNLDTAAVRYAWAAGDTDVAGDYFGEFVVTYPGPVPETFPDTGYVTIGITPRLASTTTYQGLVGIGEYRLATLDTSSADTAVTGALERAQRIVADYLRRGVPGETQPLISAERTELLIIDSLFRVYPSCVPITALPSGLQARGYSVYGVVPSFLVSFIIDYDRLNTPRTSLTYTGGWTPVTLPETVREQICWKAWELLRTPLAQEGIPVGATAVHSGDASVTFKDPNPGGAAAARLSDGAKRELRPWRRIW